MSTNKNIDRICALFLVLALLICAVAMNAQALGITVVTRAMGYEERLFDNTEVHTIEITMADWDGFIETCENEEYASCSVTIDGETYHNTGIRAKGNTSLSTVSQSGSDRYSFKLEFDQYDNTQSYHGLDKLSLNNLIQDNTLMKDYLTYTMMSEFGVDAPLCSYVYITVNGEDWGLYLAVEGVEESFLQRNYGSDYGDLYKPDSLNMGGDMGGGMPDMGDMPEMPEDFDFPDMGQMPQGFPGMEEEQEDTSGEEAENASLEETAGLENFTMPQPPENFTPPQMPEFPGVFSFPEMGQMPSESGAAALETVSDNSSQEDSGEEGFTPPDFGSELPEDFTPPDFGGGMPDMGGGFGGMGSDDVKLQYIDDDPESYSTIFSSAKTEVSEEDQTRLIGSLQSLSEYENLDEVLDVDEVLRYFVVHNFVVNGDSYTGSMIHNYYLYEEDGQLSMIPWDYNLAFGTFQSSDASSAVNEPIDDVLEDRPMQAWIFSSEEYTEMYHAYYAEFLETVDMEGIIDEAYALIAEYAEKDPTSFCTYEEFEAGVEALKEFCTLRTESVSGQLDGTIPATSEEQSGSDALVDTGELDLSDMGTMGSTMGGGTGGGFGGRGGEMPGFPGGDRENQTEETDTGAETENPDSTPEEGQMPEAPTEGTMPDMGELPEDFTFPEMGQMPEGGTMPEMGEMPQGGTMPDMGEMPQGGTMPEMGQMPQQPEETEEQSVEETAMAAMPQPGNMPMPGGMPQMPQGENGNMPQPGDFGGDVTNQTVSSSGTVTGEQWLLLGASAGLMLFGLLFALLFRRRR